MLYSYVGSFQRNFRVTLHEVLLVTIFYLCSSMLCQTLGRKQLLVYFDNSKSMMSTTIIFMKSILNNFIKLRKSQRRVAPVHNKPLEGKFRCKYYEPISQQPGGTSIGLTRQDNQCLIFLWNYLQCASCTSENSEIYVTPLGFFTYKSPAVFYFTDTSCYEKNS